MKDLVKEETRSKAMAHYEPEEEKALTSDLIIPYVTMGQGLSEAVMEKKVDMGDIYRSTNFEVLGSPDKPLEVVFLHLPKSDWVIEEKNKAGKFEYRRSEPRTAKNETLNWSFWADADGNEVDPGTRGATEHRRVKRLTVFAILPHDIEAYQQELEKAQRGELPDPNKALTPVAISFRSYGYNAGKKISTLHTRAKTFNTPLWAYKVPLTCYLEKNDQGTFYVWDVKDNEAKGVPKDQLPAIEQWAQLVGSQSMKVHEEGDSTEHEVREAAPTNKKNAKEVC